MFMFSNKRINSCMLKRWYMSIQMRTKAELINIVLKRWIQAQRSATKLPEKSQSPAERNG
jgi:hypothetical protein